MTQGSAGFGIFQETLAKAVAHRQLMNKSQKLRLSALERRAVAHDLLGNWQPLIDRVFEIWEEAIGIRPLAHTLRFVPQAQSSPERVKIRHGRKSYVVVRDSVGVIRVEYLNAVSGSSNLFHDGALMATLRKAFPDVFKPSTGPVTTGTAT